MVVYCWPKPDTGLSLTKQNPEPIWATLASRKNAQVKVPQRGCNRDDCFPHTEAFIPNATQELSINCISRTWNTSRYGLKRKNLGQEHILWFCDLIIFVHLLLCGPLKFLVGILRIGLNEYAKSLESAALSIQLFLAIFWLRAPSWFLWFHLPTIDILSKKWFDLNTWVT